MKFTIATDQNLRYVKGKLTVVIDVLRAFTTACYIMNNNPNDYIVTHDLNLAYKLKKENPDYVLLGERHGVALPGFDYGNSPAEIKDVNFSNKTIIHTTTLGTKGIVNALEHTNEVITGSFVNAKAVTKYIKKENIDNVYLFCTDGRRNKNEDFIFAEYIKGYFNNKPLDMNIVRKNLIKHESGIKFLINPKTQYSKRDFSLALELDKFNFVLKAKLDKDKLIHLKKIDL